MVIYKFTTAIENGTFIVDLSIKDGDFLQLYLLYLA